MCHSLITLLFPVFQDEVGLLVLYVSSHFELSSFCFLPELNALATTTVTTTVHCFDDKLINNKCLKQVASLNPSQGPFLCDVYKCSPFVFVGLLSPKTCIQVNSSQITTGLLIVCINMSSFLLKKGFKLFISVQVMVVSAGKPSFS